MLQTVEMRERKCLKKWAFEGLDFDGEEVRAVIHNTQDKFCKKYIYTEEVLLTKIKRIKRIPPNRNAMHLMSILSAGLRSVRKYKITNGYYL